MGRFVAARLITPLLRSTLQSWQVVINPHACWPQPFKSLGWTPQIGLAQPTEKRPFNHVLSRHEKSNCPTPKTLARNAFGVTQPLAPLGWAFLLLAASWCAIRPGSPNPYQASAFAFCQLPFILRAYSQK